MKAYWVALFTIITVYALTAQTTWPPERTPLSAGAFGKGAHGEINSGGSNNVAALWTGVWKEGTNGLRVQLYSQRGPRGNWLMVGVGSVVLSAMDYVGPPDGGFLKFELRDATGSVVPFRRGKTVEGRFPATLPIKDFPRWSTYGGLKHRLGFFSNRGPTTLREIELDDLFRIREGGNYTLTVHPVMYQLGTNAQSLDRVDLPEVTAKLALYSNGE